LVCFFKGDLGKNPFEHLGYNHFKNIKKGVRLPKGAKFMEHYHHFTLSGFIFRYGEK
jgi:hypothetical protein